MPAKDQAKLDNGYKALSFINLDTEEIFYEYEKKDKKSDEMVAQRVKDLEQRVSDLESKI